MDKIRQGGTVMPAYRHTLTDAISRSFELLQKRKVLFEGDEPRQSAYAV